MKKVKNLFMFIALLLLPLGVFASGGVTVNKTSMSFNVGGSDTFKVSASNAAGKVTFSSNNTSICTVSQSSYWLDNDSTTVTVKGNNVGTCTISINIDVATYDRETIKNTKTISVSVNKPKSGTNTLSNLTIDGKTISGFSSGNTYYDLGNKNATSINIGGSVTDSKSSISGIGSKTLNYGKNTFTITVTAENGSKKTYTIVVTRPDPRSTNNNLKELSVDFDKLNFDVNNTYYSYKVEHNLEQITINAVAEDSKAKISGNGTFTLKDHINEFKVVVTAENQTTKTYLIKVIRKDADGNYGQLNNDSSLKSLSIENYNIQFNKDTKEYDLLINEDVNELVINAQTNVNTSNINIEGNTNLKPGLNKVQIKVIAEDDSTTLYTIDVYKKGEIILDKSESVINENNNYAKILFLIALVELGIIIFLLVYFLVIKKKRK